MDLSKLTTFEGVPMSQSSGKNEVSDDDIPFS
jgi:hypothetical protein